MVKGSRNFGEIIGLCKNRGIVIKEVTKEKLDKMVKGTPHQGVAAFFTEKEYETLDDAIERTADKENSFFLVLDGIEDVHNYGAILRSAEAFGVDGVIIGKRRSAPLNEAAYKASAGAASIIPVIKEVNLVNAAKKLKTNGFWVYGADAAGEDVKNIKFSGKVCLVIGSEGFGISNLLEKECDFLISLKMHGLINSLNASVAAGILISKIKN